MFRYHGYVSYFCYPSKKMSEFKTIQKSRRKRKETNRKEEGRKEENIKVMTKKRN